MSTQSKQEDYSFSLYKNDPPKEGKSLYYGSCTINGVRYWLNGNIKEFSKAGAENEDGTSSQKQVKFIAGRIKAMENQPPTEKKHDKPRNGSNTAGSEEEIPF